MITSTSLRNAARFVSRRPMSTAAAPKTHMAKNTWGELSKTHPHRKVSTFVTTDSTTMKEDANVGATYFYRDYWGLTERPTTSGSSAGQLAEELGFITALCNACGADGKASKSERDFIKGVCSAKGILPEAITKIDELCDAAEKKSIEQVAEDAKNSMSTGTLRFASTCIIFESLKASGIDGLDEKEEVAIRAVADKIGVSPEKVDELKELLADEEKLLKRRIALCLPDHPCLDEKYKK